MLSFTLLVFLFLLLVFAFRVSVFRIRPALHAAVPILFFVFATVNARIIHCEKRKERKEEGLEQGWEKETPLPSPQKPGLPPKSCSEVGRATFRDGIKRGISMELIM